MCTIFLCQMEFAQFRNDNSHNGVYRDAILGNEVELQWKVKTGGAVRSSPTQVGERVLVGSSDGFLHCLEAENGNESWKYNAESAISSSPVVAKGIIYVASRNNVVHAVRVANGSLVWKRTMGIPLPYEWAFDYYLGSATVDEGTVYCGSADGNLYALGAGNGTVLWTFKASSLVRSTPAVDGSNIYFGDCSGKVYAVNKRNGKLVWLFRTIGDTLVSENFGYDRKAVISSPTLDGNRLFVGGRDGYLYALDKGTGKQLWNYDYHISWILSTVAVKDDILITGTSDAQFVHALDVRDGKELWRFQTRGPVWASPAIAGNNIVVIPSNDGVTYCLDLKTGREVWRYRMGAKIFSSPLALRNSAILGCDNGYVYALKTRETKMKPLQAVRRAVFWMKNPVVQVMRNGSDVSIRDYFIDEGYEFYDETDVAQFLRSRIQSDTASVLVFATNIFLPELTKDTMNSNLIKDYLKSGGKIVVLGLNPAVYAIDFEKKEFSAYDFNLPEQSLGIRYRYKDLRSFKGFYPSTITEEGRRWGLKNAFVGVCGMPIDAITTPLALDENGFATAWVKRFSPRNGSGFVQLNLAPERLDELPDIQRVAEYGMR